jgi:NADP-dependent 3-hydroxy acid dehydrogenase YdfG
MIFERLNKKYPSKTVFITGAASGLGECFARLFAQNNWTLHLSDIEIDKLSLLVDSLNIGKEKIFTHTLDVCNINQFKETVDQIYQSGTIDVLINNAGIAGGDLIEKHDPELWYKMIEVNLFGVFNGTRCVLPYMKNKNCGLIINIGSAAGFMNIPGASAYNASKAAVFSLSETLKYEMLETEIKISVVTPTFFKTNLIEKAQGNKASLKFVENQMKHSTTTSMKVAEYIISQAEKEKFHIIFPFDAKRNFFIKKWFPFYIDKLYLKLLKKIK